MATANCVSALVKAGAPTTRGCVHSGCAYLIAEESQWSEQGREIDLALALEAILLGDPAHILNGRHLPNAQWRDQILTLLDWLRVHPLLNDRRTVGLPPADGIDEPTKVLLVAAVLDAIVWDIVRHDLARLIGDVVDEDRAKLDRVASTQKMVTPPSLESAIRQPEILEREFVSPPVDELQRRKNSIREKIEHDIADHNKVMQEMRRRDTIDAFRNKRAELQNDLTECESIAQQLTENTPRNLVRALDALGNRVLGNSWEPIFPEENH
jgi:hypothetical protein